MSASASISPAVLAPALLPLPLVFFLQGVFLIQVYHCTRTHAPSWRINSPYTKTHVFLLVVLSLVHVGLLTAVEYNIFVSNFGVVDTLARADASVLGRCSKLSASLLSLTAQAFFATRVYRLPWRLDFLFLPLPFLFFASLGSVFGFASYPRSSDVDILHKLDIAAAVFPLLLGAWCGACLFAYLTRTIFNPTSHNHNNKPSAFASSRSVKSTSVLEITMQVLRTTLHAGLPGTLLLFFANIGAVLRTGNTGEGWGGVAEECAGPIQAICMIYALASRVRSDRNTSTEMDEDVGAEADAALTKDLSWTFTSVGTAVSADVGLSVPTPRAHAPASTPVALLPIHHDPGRMRKERDGFEWGWSREVHVAGSVEGARDNGMKDRDDTHYSVKRSNDKRSNDGRDEHDPDASWFEPPTPGLKSAQGDTESTPYSQAKSPSVPAPTLYSYSTPDLNFTSPSPPPSNFTSNRPSSIASIDTITTRYSTPSTLPPASVDTHTATDNNHHDSLSLSHKLTGAFEAGLSTGPPSFVSSEPSIRSHSHFHFPSRAATLDVPVPAHLDPRSRPKRTSSIPPSPLPVPAAPFRPSHVHTHSGSGSGYSFMPPGLYDPRAFEAIYEREREGGEV